MSRVGVRVRLIVGRFMAARSPDGAPHSGAQSGGEFTVGWVERQRNPSWLFPDPDARWVSLRSTHPTALPRFRSLHPDYEVRISSDDINRGADRKTERAVRASLIDGDFRKPVRILIPEGRARRPISERPRALENPTRRGKPRVRRQHRRPQARHGIAEVIEVDDLAEVVRPIRPAIGPILARPAGWRFAAREPRGNRREEVAPVKARREALRLPIDVPAHRLCGTTLDELEDAVARADVPAVIGVENDGGPRAADTGIDDAEEYGAWRKPRRIGRQQIGGRLGVAGRRVGEEIDRGYARRHLVQHGLHLTRIGAVQAEIREQNNHCQLLRQVRPATFAESAMTAPPPEPLRGTGGLVRGPWHAIRPDPFSSWNQHRLDGRYGSLLRRCPVRGLRQGRQEHGRGPRCGD